MTLLPLFLDLHDRRVLLVGAGRVARAKALALAPTGCALTVVSLQIPPEFRTAVKDTRTELVQRAFAPSDLDGAVLVISATNDATVNAAVATEARARGVLINAVDDPPACDAFFAATLRRGPVTLAISTEGAFPGLSRSLRRALQDFLPDDHADLYTRLAHLRRRLRGLPDAEVRRATLSQLLDTFESTVFPGVIHDPQP